MVDADSCSQLTLCVGERKRKSATTITSHNDSTVAVTGCIETAKYIYTINKKNQRQSPF